MSDSPSTLERECVLFTRYLIGLQPTPYVVAKYCEAHRRHPRLSAQDELDRLTTRVARRNGLLLALTDAYVRFFASSSLLRRKLVILLAILESAPQTHEAIDSVDPVSRPVLLLKIAGRITISAVSLIAGAVVLLPVLTFSRLSGRMRQT